MKTLSSNAELHEYLRALEGKLRQQGLMKLGDQVLFASRQASTTSTEFLGEARVALRAVSTLGRGKLDVEDQALLDSVLRQLDAALDSRR